MKKFLILTLTVILVASCGENRTAKISGTFPGADKYTVYLELITTKDRTMVDSTVIDKKGNFSFRVKLPSASPTFVNLVCKQNTIPLIVSPGEKVRVNSLGNLAYNYVVDGSPDSELLREFNTIYNSGLSRLDSLYYLYAETPATVQDASRRRALQAEYTRQYYQTKRDHIGFIVNHPGSMAALYALYQRFPNDAALFDEQNDAIYYKMVADSLSVRYPQSQHVQALQKEVEARMQNFELRQQISDQLANPQSYPTVEMSDIFGVKHRLGDLEGKVVLLDFWTATDSRSNVLNAELKEIYKEYAARGFEVYQISLDANKSLWVNAVQNQKLPWIVVNDPQGLSGIAARSFAVQGAPSNLLFDREGIMTARNIYGASLKNRVEQLTK